MFMYCLNKMAAWIFPGDAKCHQPHANGVRGHFRPQEVLGHRRSLIDEAFEVVEYKMYM